MLVLQRDVGQEVLIGRDIVIRVNKIRLHGDKLRVSLGFTAPTDIEVNRMEIAHQKGLISKGKCDEKF